MLKLNETHTAENLQAVNHNGEKVSARPWYLTGKRRCFPLRARGLGWSVAVSLSAFSRQRLFSPNLKPYLNEASSARSSSAALCQLVSPRQESGKKEGLKHGWRRSASVEKRQIKEWNAAGLKVMRPARSCGEAVQEWAAVGLEGSLTDRRGICACWGRCDQRATSGVS